MFPHWVEELPDVDISFPGASGRLIEGPHGQVVLWTFAEGGSVPPHQHGPQLGIVLAGRVRLTVDGVERDWTSGQMFELADAQVHSAVIDPGTFVIEIFQESDRHRARQIPSAVPAE
ncbi:cupin domain-containing protein [Streptacidiphilus sp. 4-A2]|nr:cupin domain-containing protein [Streptacidiphilus sp. 4-A2]